MSNELFSVYHCKSCNKIEVTQYISPEQIKEFGFTAEELKPSCPATGSYDLEELGQMTDKELRSFFLQRCRGCKRILKNRSQSGPKL